MQTCQVVLRERCDCFGVATALIGLMLLDGTSFADPIIVGHTGQGSTIETYDFATGGLAIASFATGAADNRGRGVEVVGNTVYYSAVGGDGIHLALYNNGTGGPDFAVFPNPRPGQGIQDLDFSGGDLYALTGYMTGPPIVYRLNPSTGAIIGSPVPIVGPGSQCDGFTVLPNGHFLINDGEGSATYRSYDPISGSLSVPPNNLVFTVPSAAGGTTGVDYNPVDNSLYFHGLFCFPGCGTGGGCMPSCAHNATYELARTDLNGNLLGHVQIGLGAAAIEDISVVQPCDPNGTGDMLNSFHPSPGAPAGLGRAVAYDGATTLYYTVLTDHNIYTSTTSGQFLGAIPLAGRGFLCGALSWDPISIPGQPRLWCGAYDGTGVYTIDPLSGVATFRFPHPFAPGESCVQQPPGLIDGLAFDPDDGTIWLSDDAATKIHHVTQTGGNIFPSPFNTPIHPVTGQQGCNSGIAVAPGGCLELSLLQVSSPNYPHVIVKVAKNSPSGPIINSFVHAVGAGNSGAEDLEFDANTFAPCCVLWSNTFSSPNLLTAWKVECMGDCVPPCEPLPDGSGCMPAICPDQNDTCRPKQLVYDPSTGQVTVSECGCVNNNCYPEFVNLPPPQMPLIACPGGIACPDSQSECHLTQISNLDGTTTYDCCRPCSQPPQACCFRGGGCMMDDPECCIGVGGSPLGATSFCQGPEACCGPDGTCRMMDGQCCIWGGGTALGSGSLCQGDINGDGIDDACCNDAPDLLINLTTGVLDGDGPIALGSPDDTWTVTCDVSGFPVPRPATVVGIQNSNWWGDLPPSQWISANYNGGNGNYCYESCFCLNDGFQNASLSFDLLADDNADVYLNSTHLVNGPPSFFLPVSYSTTNQALFQPGNNCIEVRVHNIGGKPTGLALTGQVTADNAQCCCEPLPNGLSCQKTTCPHPTDICRPKQVVWTRNSGHITVPECACVNITQCPGVCDDGLLCNGIEKCDSAGNCIAGDPPCPAGTQCNEAEQTCVPTIPTVSAWGLVVLTLVLLIGAKIYFARRRTATAP